jgi:molybdenum cofactor cytidylyltransferase
VIAGIVLAAGASTRFGAQKLLAPLGGVPLVRHAVERMWLSGVSEVVVVLGGDAEAVRGALAGLDVRTVVNDRFAEGMSTSMHAGIRALREGTMAAVVALGDQPTVSPSLIAALITEHRRSGKPIVVPLYGARRGHPVLFAAEVFPELLEVAGDAGGRDVISRDPERVSLVRFGYPLPPDVDTKEDLARLTRTPAP